MWRSKAGRDFRSLNLNTLLSQSSYLDMTWYSYNNNEYLGERGRFRKENHLTLNRMPVCVCVWMQYAIEFSN